MKVSLIFLAAGDSKRFGSDKMFSIVEEKPLIIKSLYNYVKNENISSIIVVCREDIKEKIVELCKEYYPSYENKIHFIKGAQTRSLSSKEGIAYIKQNGIQCDYIAITDAARCWTSDELINSLFSSLGEFDNAIPAIRRVETFRIIKNNRIKKTLKNDYLYEIQTPQVFKADKIIKAYEKSLKKWAGDDSCIYFSYYGNEKINIVKGEAKNIKVTFANDV